MLVRVKYCSTWISTSMKGSGALVVPADVANPEQVEAAAAQVDEQLVPVGIWINNAMASMFSSSFSNADEHTELVF